MIDLRAATANFFDRAAVTRAVDRATRRALARFGAFVRTRARSSIRARKGVSPPGGPPHSHVGTLRRFLFFGYDPGRQSVVIGPVPVGGTADPAALPALEYGGRSTAVDRAGRRRPLAVRARPFMGPALRAELPKLPALWRDSVR